MPPAGGFGRAYGTKTPSQSNPDSRMQSKDCSCTDSEATAGVKAGTCASPSRSLCIRMHGGDRGTRTFALADRRADTGDYFVVVVLRPLTSGELVALRLQ